MIEMKWASSEETLYQPRRPEIFLSHTDTYLKIKEVSCMLNKQSTIMASLILLNRGIVI
jgi:hypothetical protein